MNRRQGSFTGMAAADFDRDAVTAFQYGIDVSPESDILYINLAKIYAQTGEREKAKQAMHRLLDREPRNGTAQTILRGLESR